MATERDHIIPLYKGGTDDAHNIQALCNGCHQVKSRQDCGHKPKVEIGADGWPVEAGAVKTLERGRRKQIGRAHV